MFHTWQLNGAVVSPQTKLLQSRLAEAERRVEASSDREAKLAAWLISARAVESVRVREAASLEAAEVHARARALALEVHEGREERVELRSACKVLTQALQALQTR